MIFRITGYNRPAVRRSVGRPADRRSIGRPAVRRSVGCPAAWWPVLLLASILALFPAAGAAAAGTMEVLLRSATETGFTAEFTFEPGGGRDHEKGWVPDMGGCGPLERQGAPTVPVKDVSFALPPGHRSRVTVSSSAFMEKSGVRVRPLPRYEDNALEPHYIENDAIYDAPGTYPGLLAEVTDPGIRRGCPIAHLRFYPVQVDPLAEKVTIYNRITVSVTFHPSSESPSANRSSGPVNDPFFDRVVSRSVLNPGFVPKWRLSRKESSFIAGSGTLIAGGGKNRGGLSGYDDPSAFQLSDNWVRMGVDQTGLFAVTPSFLEDSGIDAATITPAGMRLFYGGGEPLPLDPEEEPPALGEIAVHVIDADENGAFDGDDVLYFFGEAAARYSVGAGEYLFNPYTVENVYWLTWDGSFEYPPARAAVLDCTPSSPLAAEAPGAAAYARGEEERLNPRSRGYWWVWQDFYLPGEETRCFDFEAPAASPGETCSLRVRLYGSVSGNHRALVSLNGSDLGEAAWYGKKEFFFETTATALEEGENTLCVSVPRDENPDDALYMDYVEVFYTKALQAEGRSYQAFPTASADTLEYGIAGFDETDENIAFFVADPCSLEIIEGFSFAGGELTFQLPPSPAGRLLVSDTDAVPAPVSAAPVGEFRLRNPSNRADYLIITAADYSSAFEPLAAYRESSDGLAVETVLLEEIYNEFAWGMVDPTAIRNFLKHAYFYWTAPAPWYCLLGGDGIYDLKNHMGFTNPRSVVPTHQEESTTLVAGDCLDDWFFYLEGDDHSLEMAGGRIPAGTPDEASAMVEKVLLFERDASPGLWKHTVTMAADDQVTDRWYTETEHTVDTEKLADSISPCWSVDRLYLVDYVPNAAGKKPDAQDALLERFGEGRVWVNYLGHGNETVLAHETLFSSPGDVLSLSNSERQPVFFAGSCSVGRFDRLDIQCLAELLCQEGEKGASASIAATKETYATLNYTMTNVLFSKLFACPGDEHFTVGEALLLAKESTGGSFNARRYVLFGDPAMRMPLPTLEAELDDTLLPAAVGPLDTVTVTGRFRYPGEEEAAPVDGVIHFRVRSSGYEDIFRVPKNGRMLDYFRKGALIYQGTADVIDGLFELGSLVPADYGTGPFGSVSAFFESTGGETGKVQFDTLAFEGSPFALDALTFTSTEGGPTMEDEILEQVWCAAAEPFSSDSLSWKLDGMPDGYEADFTPGGWVKLEIEEMIGDGNPGVFRIYAGVPDTASGEEADFPFIYSTADTAARGWSDPERGHGTLEIVTDDMDAFSFVMLRPAPGSGISPDSSGPSVSLRIDGAGHRAGIRASARSEIDLRFEDPQGIALGGFSSAGIRVSLFKEDQSLPFTSADMTGGFEFDHGSFTAGTLEFNLATLATLNATDYRLGVEVHDNTGALSETEFRFTVGDVLELHGVDAVPNPSSGPVYFVWQTIPGLEFDAAIKIYTVAGRRIKTVRETPVQRGDMSWVEWDGLDERGDVPANGLYLFRLEVKDKGSGERARATGKMAILR